MISGTDMTRTCRIVEDSMDKETRAEWVERNQIDTDHLHTVALASPDPTAFLSGFNFGFELAKLVTLREAENEAEAPLEDPVEDPYPFEDS